MALFIVCIVAIEGCDNCAPSNLSRLGGDFYYVIESGSHAPHTRLLERNAKGTREIANWIDYSRDNDPGVVIPGREEYLIYSFGQGLYVYKSGVGQSKLVNRPIIGYRKTADGIIYSTFGPIEKKLTWEDLQRFF